MSDTETAPAGQLRWRTAAQLGVSFPERTIELVVMPYETEALVPYGARMVREIISRGAFDGIERRSNRIRVNRDHVAERTVGRAVALHPSRDEGLVGVIRIARTDLGDETLALADEECLDASAGFLPFPGGEVWGRARPRAHPQSVARTHRVDARSRVRKCAGARRAQGAGSRRRAGADAQPRRRARLDA
jgi:hypothetical protein